jgi:tetratricopeptide (TPR) repeat protein
MTSDAGQASRTAQGSPVKRPLFERAVTVYRAGNLVEAEQLCLQVVAARPDFFDAFYLLAEVQAGLGKIDAALATYERTLQMWPNAARVHLGRGVLLERQKRHHEALASCDRALALRPNFPAALFSRGNLLHALGRLGEALASYDRAIEIRPDFPLALYNRGRVLQDLNRQKLALASYDRALALRPNFPEALSNRGNVLQALGRWAEAVENYDRALDLQPDSADALSNRGSALLRLNRYDEALASFDRAIALRPQHSGALSNRGLVLRQLHRFDEALKSFADAQAALPSNAEAHFGEAEILLLRGDFARGWQKYEWRSRGQILRHAQRDFAQPKWSGQEEISGKTILLHAEQGLGDTIQFCRYAPLVAARGARVILEVQESLHELASGLGGVAEIVAAGSDLPDFDVQCPLLSLPLAFATNIETIPSTMPYLIASPQRVAHWNERLGKKHRPRIGLAWSGRPRPANRSVPLELLLPLLDCEATFVSLQKEVRAEDAALLSGRSEILHFGDALKDFSDTAAVIANLDLVISIDTSVAHLAGALGKPIWILLSFTPDWRWLLERNDCPWYPTARLFRQRDAGAWAKVITQVDDALRDFLNQHTLS